MPDKSLLQIELLEFCNRKQKELFHLICNSGELTLVGGAKGIGIHLLGNFHMTRSDLYGPEDRIDLVHGDSHVHIDWGRLKRCEISSWENEGEIAFYDGNEVLFKIFRKDGPFSSEIMKFEGPLI